MTEALDPCIFLPAAEPVVSGVERPKLTIIEGGQSRTKPLTLDNFNALAGRYFLDAIYDGDLLWPVDKSLFDANDLHHLAGEQMDAVNGQAVGYKVIDYRGGNGPQEYVFASLEERDAFMGR